MDGLPKDFGVGVSNLLFASPNQYSDEINYQLLDTLFAPYAIHDVRLHRQGASGSVRSSVKYA